MTTIFGAACLLKLTGCGRATPTDAVTVPAELFRPTAAKDETEDPGAKESSSASDAVSASLAVIHERLRDLQSAHREKGRIEGELKDASERMRPLIVAARADCDAIHRAATDLRVQLPIAQAGYAAAAASYRQRAEAYKEASLRAMTLGFAAQFERLAADTPRRIGLTDRFLKELDDSRAFLAEAERCLRDAGTALAIVSGGARMPAVSSDARALSSRLGQFIAVGLEYEEKLLQIPSPPAQEAVPKQDSPAADAAPKPAGIRTVTESQLGELSRSGGGDKVVGQLGTLVSPAEFARGLNGLAPSVATPVTDPLPAGSRLEGEITTPSHSFRNPVRLEVLERNGDTFAGVVHYTRGFAVGRRGVRGRITPDGRTLTFRAEWYEGNLSPEAIRYELARDAGGFSGTWATGSLEGTIHLASGD